MDEKLFVWVSFDFGRVSFFKSRLWKRKQKEPEKMTSIKNKKILTSKAINGNKTNSKNVVFSNKKNDEPCQ